MKESDRRDVFVAHVSKNRENLEAAVGKYDESWSDLRNKLAEKGMELTPKELEELAELIRDCI